MKKTMKSVYYVLGGTVISAIAGYILVGSRIFNMQSQFFHFILAGFIISLMWTLKNDRMKILLKGLILVILFGIYRTVQEAPFTHMITRDMVYFLMFFVLSFFYPDIWSRFILNKPVIRFLGCGLVVSLGYAITAIILNAIYPTAMATLWEQMKVNWLYGLTIGMAVSLGFEVIDAVMAGLHVSSSD